MKLAKTYYDITTCDTRVQVHQGGTRSGKTYSICLALIELCYLNRNNRIVITICRKTYPALRATVMRDFFEILEKENIYDETKHNKAESMYYLYGNVVEFLSVDQSQKIRGRKRDVVFINEANELKFEDFQQLVFRTSGKIILDYNPSMEFHWIYDKVLTRDDCSYFQSTYLDNPFLTDELVAEIERLKDTDPWYWTVYGLGERGSNPDNIFVTHEYEALPNDATLLAYGLDWGYSVDPTSVVGVYKKDENIYIEELLYQTGLTNNEIGRLLRDIGIGKRDMIVADSAEPKSIEEVKRMGFNIQAARKGGDSVRVGIDLMRRHKLFIKSTSLNAIKEFRNYKWKRDRDDNLVNVPVDAFDHTVDAVRYVCLNTLHKKSGSYRLA